MALGENPETPEERSKAFVAREFEMIQSQSDHFGWKCRLEDRGDYYVIYVRIAKPEGRSFLLRLECDDYSRQAPLAEFANPDGWNDDGLKDDVRPQFAPTGDKMVDRNKGHSVMCIRGHREYYEGGSWHTGWTDPPADHDTISNLVVNVRNAINDIWT